MRQKGTAKSAGAQCEGKMKAKPHLMRQTRKQDVSPVETRIIIFIFNGGE
jgi:hypothetical protein